MSENRPLRPNPVDYFQSLFKRGFCVANPVTLRNYHSAPRVPFKPARLQHENVRLQEIIPGPPPFRVINRQYYPFSSLFQEECGQPGLGHPVSPNLYPVRVQRLALGNLVNLDNSQPLEKLEMLGQG